MIEKQLTVPVDPGDIAELHIGDIVYLSGILITGRDIVHERVIVEKRPIPEELSAILRGGVLFHAGPIVRQRQAEPKNGAEQNPDWEILSIGPTTSMRMESCEAEFLEKTGVRLVIGKGGMGSKTAEACRRLKAIHTVFPGGCAVLAASCVEKVETVHWLDAGMAEAMWVLRVRNFGPLIVSIDTQGNNFFEQQRELFEERKEKALQELLPPNP